MEPIEIWPEGSIEVTGSPESELEVSFLKQTITQNVIRPTLIPYLADADKNTGVSVIVAPGGGFKFLTMGDEGHSVARLLNNKGVNAFVLKYRVEQTPTSSGAFTRHLVWSFVKGWWVRTDEYGTIPASPIEDDAIQDGLQAIRLVRQNADKWDLQKDAIGVVGFSAGAAVALGTAARGENESRPDFVASIYGAKAVDNIAGDAPPLFIVATMDDPLIPSSWAQITYDKWLAATGNAKLHYYPEGGHGFGARVQGKASDQWFSDFHYWLEALFVKPFELD